MHGIDIELDFIRKDNIDKIWEYLKSINMNIAKIFYLHFICGMTLKEIANELDLKESYIKTNLYRTLENIKKSCLNGGEINERY